MGMAFGSPSDEASSQHGLDQRRQPALPGGLPLLLSMHHPDNTGGAMRDIDLSRHVLGLRGVLNGHQRRAISQGGSGT